MVSRFSRHALAFVIGFGVVYIGNQIALADAEPAAAEPAHAIWWLD